MSKEYKDKFSATLNLIGRRFGLQIPSETVHQWNTLVRSGMSLDKVYDRIDESSNRQAFFNHVKRYLSGDIDFEFPPPEQLGYRKKVEPQQLVENRVARLKDLFQALNEQEKSQFLSRLDRFREVTEAMREETDIDKFRRLRRLEANEWIKPFTDFLPAEITNHPNFQQYRRTLRAFARAGNSANQAKDLRKDAGYHKVNVNPSFKNRRALFRDGRSQTYLMARRLLYVNSNKIKTS